jgi:hypothetical protein
MVEGGGAPPPWYEMEAAAARDRCLRAAALEHGLDPDKTLPEDIILLAKDANGVPLCQIEMEAAVKRAEYYRRMESNV